jgi:hypothetical protein
MQSSDLMSRAKELYQRRWKDVLEQTHLHSFVAIEPDSEEYFLGRTLSEASAAAAAVYPDRRTAVLRVGHAATIEIGAWLSFTRGARSTSPRGVEIMP